MLSWSRSQTGQIDFLPEELSLLAMFEQAIAQTENNANQKNIRLLNQLSEDVVISVDEYMLNTILRNLISNAIKFTNRGGKVELKEASNNEQIIISVTDNGIGMNSDIQKKIFSIHIIFISNHQNQVL